MSEPSPGTSTVEYAIPPEKVLITSRPHMSPSTTFFMTGNILVKGEYAGQLYDDAPDGTPEAGAGLDGFRFETVGSL